MKKKTIYISGAMTGLPDLNFPAFHAAAKRWRDLGHEVRNPAEVGEEPGKSWEDYMRKKAEPVRRVRVRRVDQRDLFAEAGL